jgi:hypothetical protein
MLEVEQKVRVKNDLSLYFSGKYGVVAKIDKSSKLPICVKLEGIDIAMGFTEDELQIIEEDVAN